MSVLCLENIRHRLLAMADPDYRAFHCRLVPTVDPTRVLGVRTPQLRQLARELFGTETAEEFISILPHDYYEEYNLHGYILEQIKDWAILLPAMERFLPYVDNWATCDGVMPRLFTHRPPELMPAVDRWLHSDRVYTVRYGINVLMRCYLKEGFEENYSAAVAAVCRTDSPCGGDYYVRMGVAWYFATALAYHYGACVPWLEEKKLPPWVHNKTIQKAVESRRITPAQKAYLKSLRVK